MTTQASKDRVERIFQHVKQVQEGLIPPDSPSAFVRPEGDAVLDERGLPWWFGPSYKPAPEVIREFEGPYDGSSGADNTPPT